MANKLYQSVIHQMESAIGRVCGVVDTDGNLIACSDYSVVDNIVSGIAEHNVSAGDFFVLNGYAYKAFALPGTPVHIVFVQGVDEPAQRYCALLAVSFSEMRRCFDESFDKASFLKNLIFDNILPGELYSKSRKLLFNPEADRALFLVRTSADSDVVATELLTSMFPDNKKDFVIGVSETDAVLIREVKAGVSYAELEAMANLVVDTFETECFSKCNVGIGTVTHNIKDLPKAYKEAQIALEVGKVFEEEKKVISYENLGIGRLIYQLPTTLCQMYIDEVFKGDSIHLLDNETLQTINKFFENNLNVSETSRKLFVHRNTLVYRLDKIKKITGLDIREFDNAITFKVAIMVSRYLANNQGKF